MLISERNILPDKRQTNSINMARGNNEIKIRDNNNLYVTHVIMLSDHASDIAIVQFVP